MEHKQLLAKLAELRASTKQVDSEVNGLNKSIALSKDESMALRRTMSEAAANADSVYNKSKTISSELESLAAECDSLRLEIEKSRKATDARKLSSRNYSVLITGAYIFSVPF